MIRRSALLRAIATFVAVVILIAIAADGGA